MSVATGPVTVAEPIAREAGFRLPVVFTPDAWESAAAWTEQDDEETGAIGQTTAGRLWDVLTMAAAAIRAAEREGQRGVIDAPFTVHRIPRGIPYFGDDDDDGSYETLTAVGMYVIVGGTPATVTISLDGE